MRFRQVRAIAFGPLRDRTLELAPGMNVFYGPNEAGKSSWHAAIFGGLCGLRRGKGKPREADRKYIAAHKPWAGDEWRVAVVVDLDDGRALELHQELASRVDCRVTDLVTGGDISDELMEEGTPDGARLLGLSRRTLPATLAVRQADLLRVTEEAGALQEQLQRVAATGGADETAEAAIQRLERYHSEHVGLRKKTSIRPLQRALAQQEAAHRRRVEAAGAHDEYLELVEELRAAEASAHLAEARLAAARRALDRRRLAELQSRVEEGRRLAAEVTESAPSDIEEDRALRDRVAAALTGFLDRPEEPVTMNGRGAEEIRAELAALPPVPKGETEPSREVLDAESSWKEASQAYRIHLQSRPPDPAEIECPFGPEELRQLADDLERPTATGEADLETQISELSPTRRPTDAKRRTALMLGAVAAAAAGVTLLAVGLPIQGGVGLALGALLTTIALVGRRGDLDQNAADLALLEARLAVERETGQKARAARQASEARLARHGLPSEAEELRQRAIAIESEAAATEHRLRWQARAEELQLAEVTTTGALARLLRERLEGEGAGPNPEPSALLLTYREECRTRAREAQLASSRPTLERELAAREELEKSRQRAVDERSEAGRELLDTAAAAGLESAEGATGELVDLLVSWRDEHDRRDAQREQESISRGKLQQLLGGSTLAELEAELEAREGVVPCEPDEADEVDLGDAPDLKLDELQRAADTGREDRNRLAGQVEERERTLESVAEADESFEQARVEVARVESLEATLATTRRFLEQARDEAQRDIAPRLAEAIQDRLPQITDGRYDEVTVDPATLEVRVRSKEGSWRQATQLSHGTAEQVYLLLRVALAEHLVTTGESAPLLLDDITVQSDAHRTVAILDLLHQLSRERQIVLFSQEEEVRVWAQEKLHEPEDSFVALSEKGDLHSEAR